MFPLCFPQLLMGSIFFLLSHLFIVNPLWAQTKYYEEKLNEYFLDKFIIATKIILINQGYSESDFVEGWENILRTGYQPQIFLNMGGRLKGEYIDYFKKEELVRRQIFVVNGLFYDYRYNLLTTLPNSLDQNTGAMLVTDTSGNCFLEYKKRDFLHHSSFLSGAVVSHADILKVVAGQISQNTLFSGHYHPTAETYQQFLTLIELSQSILKKGATPKISYTQRFSMALKNMTSFLLGRSSTPKELQIFDPYPQKFSEYKQTEPYKKTIQRIQAFLLEHQIDPSTIPFEIKYDEEGKGLQLTLVSAKALYPQIRDLFIHHASSTFKDMSPRGPIQLWAQEWKDDVDIRFIVHKVSSLQ